jgi:Doubled CXXCH motif (Paired_CXXCH_1)
VIEEGTSVRILRLLMRVGTPIALLTALALLPAAARAAEGPAGGLQSTAHDFTGEASEAVGLCTFCHTPHKALSTELLWNHTLSTNPNFHWDIPATTAGTPFPTFLPTYKGPTAKCLSCHDGSVAIGNIAWFKSQKRGKPPILDADTHGQGDNVNVGFGGNMAGNHPVAMPYPLNGAPSTYNTVTTGSAGVGIIPGEWQPNPMLLASGRIRLFQDDGTGNITAGPVTGRAGLECSSCHDPHNKQTLDELFLRGTLTGNTQASGYICLQCHIK